MKRHKKLHEKPVNLPESYESSQSSTSKKNRSSFFAFCEKNRPKVVMDLSSNKKHPSSREVNGELGRLWRSLDPAVKQEYASPRVKAKVSITSRSKKTPRNAFDVFMRGYFKEASLTSREA